MVLLAQRQERRLARLEVGQGNKLVEGGGQVGNGHAPILQRRAGMRAGLLALG